MTQERNIKRRTFMGTLAAASAGALSSPGVADTEDDDAQGSASSSHVAPYASPTGRINTEGLDEAFADWNNGNIPESTLDDVIAAWNTGERVVDKTVVELSNNISEDTTLEKNPNDQSGDAVVYKVTSTINVSAELTIDAGVVMEFQQGTQMNFENGSTILAEGTAQEGIFISATNATRGWWDGFYMNSGDVNNRMEYVTMEYGGRDLNGNIDMASGFGASGALQLTNCTLRRSEQYGLYMGSGSELLGGTEQNTYSYNGDAGLYARTSNMHTVSGTSTFVDNDTNVAFVSSNTLSADGPDSDSRTWDNLGVPWRMDGGHTVNEVTLNVQSGATFEFTQQSELFFDNNARMNIVGDAESPITFTGSEKQRGWWDGIYAESTDTENIMDNVVVEYGANGYNGNLTLATNFGESAELKLKNCTFREAGGYGLYGGSNVTLKETGNNTYTANTDGAARIQGPTMDDLSDSSDFTGNDRDFVLVSTNNISGTGPDDQAITWDNINVPWRIDGELSVDEIELIVDPGATFEFTESSQLFFENNARINMVGFDETAEREEDLVNEITFTATTKERGWWDGIYIESDDAENVMERVVIEYAGDDFSGNLELGTNFGESAELVLDTCTLRNSAGYGLYGGSNVVLREGSGLNTYTGNASGAARIQAPTMHMLSDSSDFTGNDSDYVLVSTNNVTGADETITWDNINVPWRIDGSLTVNDYELVVDPGATFEFTESSSLFFDNSSVMTIEGTEGSPITFTGTTEERGWWDGIYLETESLLNTMAWTVIEYGGDDRPGNLTVGTNFGETGRISITNCTFREADGFGLYGGTNTNYPDSENNTYTANTSGAASLKMDSIHHLSDTSDFTGNDDDVVEVRNATLASGDLPSGQDAATWDAINVPYRFKGTDVTHTIDDVELIIDPGATLEFEEQGQLQFNADSVVTIEGTAENPITFTGTEEVKGWWDGIYLRTESFLNVISNAIVEYGGRGLGGNITLGTGFGEDASVEITDCTIRNSLGAGVYADDDDQPRNASSLSSDNTFSGNDGGDYVVVDA